jgi:hypothetical protein
MNNEMNALRERTQIDLAKMEESMIALLHRNPLGLSHGEIAEKFDPHFQNAAKWKNYTSWTVLNNMLKGGESSENKGKIERFGSGKKAKYKVRE